MDLKEHYSELVSLTQVFLLRNYSLADPFTIDPATHRFFQKWNKRLETVPMPVRSTPAAPIYATNPPPSPDPFPPQTQPEPHPATPNPEPSVPPSPKPRPPEVPNRPHSHSSPFLSLEPLKGYEPMDLQDFKKIFKEQFPTFSISEQIPSDEKAQQVKNSWQTETEIPPVLILSFHEGEKSFAFLRNIAFAIHLHLTPARVISGPKLEQEKKWDKVLNTKGLRLIIASDYGLYLLPELMKYYKEAPRQAKHFLNQIPLLLLSDPSLYLKEPHLKAFLWQAILNELTIK
jgi:hypothetical protein